MLLDLLHLLRNLRRSPASGEGPMDDPAASPGCDACHGDRQDLTRGGYSARSAAIGSTAIARRAGSQIAANATTVSAAGPATSASGSRGLTP
jgi:hypothetical protein